VNVIAVIMLSIMSLVAVVPGAEHKSPSPPAKSSPPLTKYQRERLAKFKVSAPADEYFGRQKMSYLGINNTFHDTAISAGDHTVDPSIMNKVAAADEAMEDWARHFPHDPQLARTYFLAIRSEQKIWVQQNQLKAWIYMNRVATLFPDTYFGKLVKKDIAIGFTEHYYAEPVPCATPTPVATAMPATLATAAPRKGRSKATPTPEPTAPPTPEPTATPEPSPTPRAIAKGLKVQIETPACVQPPAPSPSATAMPVPSASPAAPR
jgi:hypothetical protein